VVRSGGQFQRMRRWLRSTPCAICRYLSAWGSGNRFDKVRFESTEELRKGVRVALEIVDEQSGGSWIRGALWRVTSPQLIAGSRAR